MKNNSQGQSVSPRQVEGDLVYILDVDPAELSKLQVLFHRVGYRVECFTSVQQLIMAAGRCSPTCFVLEWHLPEVDGSRLLDQLFTLCPQAVAIILTAESDLHQAVHALRSGASDFIGKPYSQRQLVDRIRDAIVLGPLANRDG